MNSALDIIKIMEAVGAVITDDHFVYTSGKHGSVYINKDALYPHVEETSQVGELFATALKEYGIETVAAPALGGIILSQWAAYHLSKMHGEAVHGVYAEKGPDKTFLFTRGYDAYIKGKKVAVLEDLTTTGGSVKKVVEGVREYGGEVVVVAVMVNRNPEEVNKEMFGAPFVALGELVAAAYEETECPLCEENVPINTEVGHGRKYLEGQK